MGNVVGRRDQRNGTRRGGGAETGANLTFGVWLQQVAIHIAGAAAHRSTGHDVLGNRFLHKAGRGVNLHFTGFHVSFIDHATDTAVVVHMAVGKQHRHHRFFRPVGKIERQSLFGRFGA